MKYIKEFYLRLPKKHQILLGSFATLLLVLIILPQNNANDELATEQIIVGQRYQLPLFEEETNSNEEQEASLPVATLQHERVLDTSMNDVETSNKTDDFNWQTFKVKSGDSLAKIFQRAGFSAKTTHDVVHADGDGSKQLLKLIVGETLQIAKDENGNLLKLAYPLSDIETLFIVKTPEGFAAEKEVKDLELRQAFAHGTIKSNFWNAGVDAGLSDNQIINLANIFGWDVDFAIDIREGDSFHIVYEQKYVDGEYVGTGHILAAEFVNQNERFQAVRYTDGDYYTPEGDSMKKAFLRAPVNFKYISSNFKSARLHPVQKVVKAHRGTDYAAKTGTPVVAAGDGKVIASTYNQYNGNYVFIQHGEGIVTKYLHFSKRAVKAGQRVKQGQIIGYVGATGLAAGPHLHYEFLLNGVHRNPRTVELPNAQPIPKSELAKFTQLAKQQLSYLQHSKETILAMR